MSDNCIFCSIIAGDAEASFVYEDDLVVSFLTIGPVTDGHLMVVPRAHMPFLADLNDEVAGRMYVVARRLAQALRDSGLPCEGVNLFQADGSAAFQEVFHSHLHVFARYRGDGFRLSANWDHEPTRSDLDNHAAAIREVLAGT